jgi:hypothetical protein
MSLALKNQLKYLKFFIFLDLDRLEMPKYDMWYVINWLLFAQFKSLWKLLWKV